jgi:hypothetical protein
MSDEHEKDADEVHASIQLDVSEGDEEESVVQVKVTLNDLINPLSVVNVPVEETSLEAEPETQEPEVIQPPTQSSTSITPPRESFSAPAPAPQSSHTAQEPQASSSASPATSSATYSTSEAPQKNLAEATTQPEDIIQLGIRLGRALTRLTMRGLQAMIDYVDTATSDDPSKAEQQKANLQVLFCVMLILVAGILLSSRSGPSLNKWDFYLPPPV